MQVFSSMVTATPLEGCAVAIGNFDGVHLGHQRLFAEARARATLGPKRRPAVALTFEPHPARVLKPSMAPPLLTPLARKLELIAGYGMDAAVVQPFDASFAQVDAEAFVERHLVGMLKASQVIVGYDFTAGKGRSAGTDALRALLMARGVELQVVPPVAVDGLVVSSTKIREFLLEGRVDAAALLLTRPYDLDGRVERGAGRGRGIGFPTANIDPGPPEARAMLPGPGVYAVRARVGGPEGSTHDGACNIGIKPTVSTGGPVVAEVHLLDFPDRDLYGTPVRLAFVHRLREERRFPSVAALREQIARDIAQARALLSAAPGK
jgi:riboflavin kinase/FMN adenylyltransferase